jgi:signal transduction histidine kinase
VAIVCTALLAYLDAYDWFYHHTRKHEAYEIDDVVTFLTLFLVVGLLLLSLRRRKEALLEIANRKKAEEALEQLNLELEKRIERRTAQCERELEERKRAEEKLIENQKRLRALSSELSSAEERTRRRIATDLHDTIGHTLALTSNQLGLLRASIPTAQDKELLAGIRAGVKEAIHYSRSLISELNSPSLNHLSFVSAVEWLAGDILERNGIAVRLRVDDDPRLPDDDTRGALIKALREILVNVVKHAKACNVEVWVHPEGDDMTVRIEDDGIGFDVPGAAPHASPAGPRGFGILTVSEQLARLNGRCSISSEPGRGTSVTLSAPMKKGTTETMS